jgi:tetratricopeptide (TPR) repeat protein
MNLEGYFPKTAAALRLRAEHRRNLRHWGAVDRRERRRANAALRAHRAAQVGRFFFTFRRLSLLTGAAFVALWVYSDATHPQLYVKSFKALSGLSTSDEALTEAVRHRLAEIRTRDDNTAPGSDFLMYGEQLDFHVFGSELPTPHTIVHWIEHGIDKEPPEVTGDVSIQTDKNGRRSTTFSVDITAGGQAPYARSIPLNDTDILKIVDAIAEQILYHQDPYLLAVYHYRNQEPDKAVKIIQDYCLGNPRFASQGSLLWGRILNDQNHPDEAIGKFQEALALGPKTNEFASAIKGGISRALLAKGDPSALKVAEEAVHLNPKYARSYVHLGNALLSAHRDEEALKSFQKAIELSPRFATPYKGKGDVFVLEKKYALAISAYEMAIRLNPKELNVHFPLAKIYEDLKQYPEAIHTYQRFRYAFLNGMKKEVEPALEKKLQSLEKLEREQQLAKPAAPSSRSSSQGPSFEPPRAILTAG